MKKKNLRKYLVIGIMILFVGVSVIPSISGNIGESSNLKDVDSEKGEVDQKTQTKPNGGVQPQGWHTRGTELVSVGSNKNAINPDIAVDPYGMVHAVWCDWSDLVRKDYDILYSYRNTFGIWSPKVVVSTESDKNSNRSVSLAIEDLGGGQIKIHVAWLDYSDYNGCGLDKDIFYKCKVPGLDWDQCPTEVVSTESDKDSGQPDLAVDINGGVHVAWADLTNYPPDNDDRSDIFYKFKQSGGSWPTIDEVVSIDSTDGAGAPSLDLGYNGSEVHVAWHDLTSYPQDNDNDKYDILYRKKSYGTWSLITELVSTESDHNAQYPSLAWDKYYDTVHVAWMDQTKYIDPATGARSGQDGRKYDIFYKIKDSSIWSPTEVVSTESSLSGGRPSIDTDSYSRVHIAWSDLTWLNIPNTGPPLLPLCGSDGDIFYKSKPRTCNGWWMYTDVVSSESTEAADSACLVIAPDDSIHIAWHDKSIRTNYADIVYKLGAGTTYTLTNGYLWFRGHGFLDCTNGIYDFDFKTKKGMFLQIVYFIMFWDTHFLVSPPILNHLPREFLYTHGTLTTPLPSHIDYVDGLCAEVSFGDNFFWQFLLPVHVGSSFVMEGTSYP